MCISTEKICIVKMIHWKLVWHNKKNVTCKEWNKKTGTNMTTKITYMKITREMTIFCMHGWEIISPLYFELILVYII